jgi:hypothetical protein
MRKLTVFMMAKNAGLGFASSGGKTALDLV